MLVDTDVLIWHLMGDAPIAATALELGVPLLTGNVRHFAPIASLQVEGFTA